MLESIWDVTWKIGLFLVAWGTLYAPFIILARKKLNQADSIQSLSLRLYLETAGMITILIVAGAMLHFANHYSFVSMGFELQNSASDSLLGLIIGTGILLLTIGILWLGRWLRLQPSGNFSWSVVGLAGFGMLVNTLTQEVLVRGYIFQTIQAGSTATLAVILSSMIFAILHISSARHAPLAMFNAFLMGLLLGYARLITGNLWMPIGMHFVWNFLLGPVLGLEVSGKKLHSGWRLLVLQGSTLFTGGHFGPEGGLVTTLVTIFVLAGFYGLYH